MYFGVNHTTALYFSAIFWRTDTSFLKSAYSPSMKTKLCALVNFAIYLLSFLGVILPHKRTGDTVDKPFPATAQDRESMSVLRLRREDSSNNSNQ